MNSIVGSILIFFNAWTVYAQCVNNAYTVYNSKCCFSKSTNAKKKKKKKKKREEKTRFENIDAGLIAIQTHTKGLFG